MFHEIDQDKIDRVRGIDITVVTTAKNDDEGRALLKQLGFPFRAAAPQAEPRMPRARVRGIRPGQASARLTTGHHSCNGCRNLVNDRKQPS